MSKWIKKLSEAYAEVNEKKHMDPVDHSALKGSHKDRKDKDIDNDGDVDKSDEYLHNRRKTVKKAMAKEGDIEMNPKKKEDKKAMADTMEEVDLEKYTIPLVIEKTTPLKTSKRAIGHSHAELGGSSLGHGAHELVAPSNDRYSSGDDRAYGHVDKKTKKFAAVQVAAGKKTSPQAVAKAMGHKEVGKHHHTIAKFHNNAMDENTLPPVYARILENRDKHMKGATPPEGMHDKSKSSKGAMDMLNTPKEIVDNPESEKIKDPSKQSPLRKGDNAQKDSMQAPKDTTKAA